MSKDKSGFSPQERHQIIVDYLKDVNKPTKVFHLRWKPGDLLDGKVLESTPMFWYMKYKWGRQEIETMFYKARCVIGPTFDQALQQTFGGDPGPRWRGAIPDKKKSKWRERQAEKTANWQAEQAEKMKQKEEEERQRKIAAAKQAVEEEKRRKEEEKKLASKSKDIWNAVSDFGADKAIDYKTFSENLKDRGINVSPLLAKQLFDQLAGPGGKLTRQQMEELIKKLDAMTDASTITWDMLGDKLGCMTIMKRVLLAAGSGEPFNVDDFVFAQKFSFNISTIQFMNKLTDRDVPWDDRVRAMEQLGANLGTNPMFNNVLAKNNIPDLLCGWATQILDSKPEVQKTAIDTLPAIFHNALEFGDKDIAVGHLEEILDNLFKVLDDPNVSRNHPAAMDAIDKLIDDVLNTGDPESVLFISGLLAEKTDIENVNSPEARQFALTQLQKIMFGANSPYSKFDDKKKEAPIVSQQNLPPRGTVNREWLDIGTNQQAGPSPAMMQKNIEPQSYNDFEEYPAKGITYPDNQRRDDVKEEPLTGTGADEFMSSAPITDPADPYAHLTSNPSTAKINQPVDFDASKSHDCDQEPCVQYTFDFGDGSPPQKSNKPIVPHKYTYPGSYPVSVDILDKYGKTGNASCTQRVIDPKDPNALGPPYAQLTSDPTESKVGQVVYLDASKSHDFKHEPCNDFVFTFGDGSKSLRSKVPQVSHRFETRGVFPVSVQVTDRYGQNANAGLQQRVIDPEMQDPTDPYAHLRSQPTEAKTKEPVTFDASKSCDCNGEPVKKYVFDFGDGSKPMTSFKPIVQHPYAKGGTFPVSVEVTDKFGKKANAELSQRVKNPFNKTQRGPPYAAVDSTPPQAEVDEPVTFSASKSHDYQGDPCELFVWDFGDGAPKKTSTTPIVQHPYTQPGTYPVTVKVTDKYGQTTPAKCNQRVAPPMPYFNKDQAEKVDDPYVAVNSTPTNAKPKQPITFDATKSHDMDHDPLQEYVWDFGDGTPKVTTKSPVIKHQYDDPGTYPVKVIGTDKYGKQGDAKLNQLVTDPKNPNSPLPPYANVISNPTEAQVTQPVKFDASKSHDQFNKPCVQFVWDFGDHTPKVTTPSARTTHAYTNPGTYPVKVVVTDKNGLSAQAGLNQKVTQSGPSPEDPYAAVSSTPQDATPKQPVHFDASKSHDEDGDPCKTFKWDFGDGTPPQDTTTPCVNHVYDQPGTYPVKCTVTDKNGRTGDAGLTQKITDPKNPNTKAPPYASVKSTPPEAAITQPVKFDASESHDMNGDPCKKFVWDFGDKTPKKTTDVPYIDHPYARPGVYPVSVQVTDKNGLKSDAQLNQRIRTPKPEDPYASLQSTPPDAKPKEPVKFDASRSIDPDGDPCKTFVFDFGDGTPPVHSPNPVVNHAYEDPGTYPVSVTVTDKYGNRGNAALQQKVDDPLNPFHAIGNEPTQDPYVSVASTPPTAKPSQPVTFDASKSHDMDGDPCKNYTFDFGDGSPVVHTPKPVVQHAYDEPGTYPVKVIATDKYGRQGPAHLSQQVRDPKNPSEKIPPYAAVDSTPPEAKVDEPVKLDASKSHDMDKKPCVKFVWDFGDDTPVQTTKTPVVKHPYTNPGVYPVSVQVTDKHGLTSDAGLNQKVVDEGDEKSPMKGMTYPQNRRKDDIKEDKPSGGSEDFMQPPYAALTSTPPEAVIKQPVTCDASPSKDYKGDPCVKFVWDFGDGTPKQTSKEPVVEHEYKSGGTYPISVEVMDKDGLSGRAQCNQRVREPEEEDPFAHVSSDPQYAEPKQPVTFDASKSHDMDGDPCKKFIWDYGDGTPPETTSDPVSNHCFNEPGTYPVNVTVVDKYGRKGNANLTQNIKDPVKPDEIMPPVAEVESHPHEAVPKQPVIFDASKSRDFEGGPCEKFEWDFGDGSRRKITTDPETHHAYGKGGTYPVSVQVTDKHGQTARAGLNQRVRPVDPEDPYVALSSTPPMAKPKEPVHFDASKSVDQDGDPCKNYTFDFGDGSPIVHTPKPVVQHAYDNPGTYPVSVIATDKYGRKGNAAIQQKVIDPQNPNAKDPPYANVTSTPADARPSQPVTFDASKSHDMDKKPCVKYVWDFGDGTPEKVTKNPVVKHAYKKPDVYPVNVQVTDKHGLTGDAFLNQRVSDPSVSDNDPSRGGKGPKVKNYGGKKAKGRPGTEPVGNTFDSRGGNKPQPVEEYKNEPGMEPEEIGDEFRNIVHEATSNAILDPNMKNKRDGKKLAGVMKQLDPSFAQELDPEAKRQFGRWERKPQKPMGKYRRPLPSKPLPKRAEKRLHHVETTVHVDVGPPIMPDI